MIVILKTRKNPKHLKEKKRELTLNKEKEARNNTLTKEVTKKTKRLMEIASEDLELPTIFS